MTLRHNLKRYKSPTSGDSFEQQLMMRRLILRLERQTRRGRRLSTIALLAQIRKGRLSGLLHILAMLRITIRGSTRQSGARLVGLIHTKEASYNTHRLSTTNKTA